MTQEERSGRGRGRNMFGRYRGRGRGRPSSAYKAAIECFKCHKKGHFHYECPDWERSANFAELEHEDEMLLMAYVEEKKATREEIWFLDSGCSNHMSGNKEWFTNLNEDFKQTVKLGNDSRIAVMGIGSVRLCVNDIVQVPMFIIFLN